MNASSAAKVQLSPLEALLACPRCGAASLSIQETPRCGACSFAGRWTDGILDLVDEGELGEQHRAELEAQSHAVGEYYENEEKLSCHWDRISADDLPPLLDWPQGQVLDLGCATGVAGAAFRRAGATVIGADFSVPCLKAAARRLDDVLRASAEHLPFKDEAFDCVVARGALHHFAHPQRALEEVARVLRPGGQLLVADPREFAWLEPIKLFLRRADHSFSDDHHAFTPEEYAALVAERFEIVEERAIYPLGILAAVGLDLVPLPKSLPRRLLAESLLGLDRRLNKTPAARLGHLLVIKARKPAR